MNREYGWASINSSGSRRIAPLTARIRHLEHALNLALFPNRPLSSPPNHLPTFPFDRNANRPTDHDPFDF